MKKTKKGMLLTVLILALCTIIYAAVQFFFNYTSMKHQAEKQAVTEQLEFEPNKEYKEPFQGQEGYYLAVDLQPLGWDVTIDENGIKTRTPVFDSSKRIYTRHHMSTIHPAIFDTYLGEYVLFRMSQKEVNIWGSILPDAWLGEYYEWDVSLKYPRLRNVDIVEPTLRLVLYNNDFQRYNLELKFRFIPVQKRRDDAGEIIYHIWELDIDDLNEKFTFDPPLNDKLFDHMDEINSDFILSAELTITDSRNNIVLSETHSYTDNIDPNQKDSLRGAVLSSVSFLERFSLVKTPRNSGKLSNPNRRMR